MTQRTASLDVPLTEKQFIAIRLMLEGGTREVVAAGAGVNKRQLSRWMEKPAFRAELKRQQDILVRANTAALVGVAETARSKLNGIVEDDEVNPSVRVRAGIGLLREAREAVEQSDLVERVAELEAALGEETGAGGGGA